MLLIAIIAVNISATTVSANTLSEQSDESVKLKKEIEVSEKLSAKEKEEFKEAIDLVSAIATEELSKEDCIINNDTGEIKFYEKNEKGDEVEKTINYYDNIREMVREKESKNISLEEVLADPLTEVMKGSDVYIPEVSQNTPMTRASSIGPGIQLSKVYTVYFSSMCEIAYQAGRMKSPARDIVVCRNSAGNYKYGIYNSYPSGVSVNTINYSYAASKVQTTSNKVSNAIGATAATAIIAIWGSPGLVTAVQKILKDFGITTITSTAAIAIVEAYLSAKSSANTLYTKL